jgi:hypothetical protein
MDSTSVPQYIPPADEVAGKASPAGHHEPEEAQPVEVAGYVYMGDASTLTPCSLGEHPKPIAGPNVALYLFGHVRDAETKDVVAVDVRVRQGDYRRVLTMPVSVIRATQAADPWHKHTGLSLTPAQARGASTWLSAAIATNVGRRTRFEVQRPTWTGDRLQLPSSYAKSGCTEERARECWRRAIGIARDYPKLAFTFGAYVASPLLERLGLPGGGVNLLDDSTTGKTTSGRGGSAIWGKPSPVGNDPSWHGTLGSKTDELAESGGMPLFWDDANNTAESEVTLGKLVMQIAQGIEKGRLNQHAEQRDKRTWRLIVVSTSETSLLTKGTVGAAARWVEVHGPFMPDKKTAEEVDALTREAYGWPGRLLTAEDWKLPELPALRDWVGGCKSHREARSGLRRWVRRAGAGIRRRGVCTGNSRDWTERA